jgi:hypothetical protein
MYQWLQTQPYDVQREQGLKILRNLHIRFFALLRASTRGFAAKRRGVIGRRSAVASGALFPPAVSVRSGISMQVSAAKAAVVARSRWPAGTRERVSAKPAPSIRISNGLWPADQLILTTKYILLVVMDRSALHLSLRCMFLIVG